jgi:LPXTG-motif cell wall-anchored protein
MVKRLLAAAIMTVVLLAAPAAAQQYPPAVNSLTVGCPTPTAGDTVGIEGRTFAAGSAVSITLPTSSVVVGTATADASGAVALEVTIPATTARGANTISAAGQAPDGTPLSVSASITVADGCRAAAAGVTDRSSGPLPKTGDDSSIPLAKLGLVLAAIGGVITAMAAKRRKAAAAA